MLHSDNVIKRGNQCGIARSNNKVHVSSAHVLFQCSLTTLLALHNQEPSPQVRRSRASNLTAVKSTSAQRVARGMAVAAATPSSCTCVPYILLQTSPSHNKQQHRKIEEVKIKLTFGAKHADT